MAVRTGLEPATSCVTGRHSNQLNYRTVLRGQDLNLRPPGYEPDELPDCSTPRRYYIKTAWQRPTLTGGEPPTTIGAKELNFRVRYGNGCDLFAIATRLFRRFVPSKLDNRQSSLKLFLLSPRPISICQLHVSPRFHPKPINLIIFQGSY